MPIAICAVRNGFSLAARISRPNRKVCDVLLRDPRYFCRGCVRQKAAQSGRARWRQSRQLSEVKRTSLIGADVAVIDPKRTQSRIIFNRHARFRAIGKGHNQRQISFSLTILKGVPE